MRASVARTARCRRNAELAPCSQAPRDAAGKPARPCGLPSIGASHIARRTAMPVTHPKFRAAAVQAAPVFLDLDAVDRQGVAPDRRGRRQRRQADRLPRDLAARATRGSSGSIRRPGACSSSSATTTTRWSTARRRRSASRRRPRSTASSSSMGHSEKHGGSLYMGQWIIDADGQTVAQRRKLKPTHVERTVFGEGDGSDLAVHDTRARPHRRAVLLGAPAAAVEVRDVRAERAGAHRRLAELLALPRRRLRARARGEQRGQPDLRGRGPVLRARAVRHGVEGDGRRCCAATTR